MFSLLTRSSRARCVVRGENASRYAWASGVTAVAFGVVALGSDKARVVGTVWAVVMLCLCWRIRTMGVHMGLTEIKVVGVVSTKIVPRTDVERFEVAPLGQYPQAAWLVKADGSKLPIIAIAVRGKGEEYRQRVQRPVDELNRLLTQDASTSSDPSTVQGFLDQLK